MTRVERERIYDRISEIDLALAIMGNRALVVASLSRERIDLMRKLQEDEVQGR